MKSADGSHAARFILTLTISEKMLGQIKMYRIRPSEVCIKALRNEISNKKRVATAKERDIRRRQVINRFSGEVLLTRPRRSMDR